MSSMHQRKKRDGKKKKKQEEAASSSSSSEYVTETETPEGHEPQRAPEGESEEREAEEGKGKERDDNDSSEYETDRDGVDGESQVRLTRKRGMQQEGSQIGSQIGSTIGGSTIGGHWNLDEDSVVPVTISFENLFYSVQKNKGVIKQIKQCKNPFEKERFYILKDLHGSFKPGEVTAIMGPSGAGKTTLLNLISGRLPGGNTEGHILINGVRRKKIPSSKWLRLTAYVMQDDILFGHLTPRETFNIAACLRLPGTLSHPSRRRDKVNSIIDELGLQDCAGTRVGSPDARGISGGQRKRVSIGVELITDPSVLFLDEPTTGLDSSTSYLLANTLKKLAMAGRTIVSTIHQPSSDIFFMFDRVIFLSRGHVLFNGPTTEMVPYFSKLNWKCPSFTNPCEYVMNLAKDDSYIASKEEGKERLQALVAAFRKTHHLPDWDFDKSDAENHDLVTEEAPDTHKRKGKRKGTKVGDGSIVQKSMTLDEANLKPNKSSNFFVQYFVLLYRAFLTIWRNPMLSRARGIQTVFMSIVVGLLFLQIGDDQSSLRDRNGSLFFTTITLSLSPVMLMQAVFPVERQVFIREHSTGSYTTLAYFLSKVSSEAPFHFIFPTLFSCIAYFMVGYDLKVEKFFIYVAALIALTNTCGAFGMALVTGFNNMGVAMALMPLLFTPMMLLGGLFLNAGSTPDWLLWAKWLSPLKYGFEILVLNEYDGLTFTCDQSELRNNTCPVATGKEEIYNLGLDESYINIWSNFLFLLLLYIMFVSIAFILLSLTAGRKKGQ